MGVRSRSKSKRRRRATTLTTGASTGGGGADLISDLSDELLVRILELLPKARDAVRTAALSRRWRGLWTRVPSLRFVSHPRGRRDFGNPISPCQFAAFVDRTLALRATQKEPPLAHLAISFDIFEFEQEEEEDLDVPLYIQATQRWIHHAIQHGVRSLVFTLDLPWPADEEGGDDDNNYYVGNPVITLDDLISSANLETMHLDFNHATLRLPSTAVFASLADLSIENIEIEDDSGVQHLTRLVSSACCPRLRKLRLVEVVFPMEETFLIDAGALLELSMEVIDELQFLELKTPSLRVLHMDGCYELEALTVSASSLEDLVLLTQQHTSLRIDVVDGHLSSVQRLKIRLWSDGQLFGDNNNDAGIQLLNCCTSTRCLQVSLNGPERDIDVDDIIKGRVPQLPHVTSLTIHVERSGRCSNNGAAIASLLSQCNNIRYLSLKFCYGASIAEVRRVFSHWKSHELSLAYLQEVEFIKLLGTDDELQLVQFILTRASGIQKVAVSFDPKYWLKDSEDGFKLIPLLAGGSWTPCNDAYLSYKWTRCV